MNKPFTPNASKKAEKMTEAAKHIQAAIAALQQAGKCSENWAEFETFVHFEYQLNEFMSCDNGEAGFQAYLGQVTKRAKMNFDRKGRPVRMTVPVD